jgi:2-desacetyl-2-hydroxyethyl bacteriochlorophyllide A dehydrogenase
MKAAVFTGAGSVVDGAAQVLRLETRDDPVPGPRDVVIRVARCGICATDLHMTSGHGWDFPTGIILGHEYAGEIVAVGRDVAHLRVGEAIAGMPSGGCGLCQACRHGQARLCAAREAAMGGFAEYLLVPVSAAVRLPQSLSLPDGALVEPLAVGLHGVGMSAIRPGARVLVLGAGAVGLATLFWARRLGAARVVMASRSPTRAEMALAMGADAFIETGEGEGERIAAALGGAPDIVFECVGAVGLLTQAIELVRHFGEVVSLGFCTAPDPVIPAVAATKQIRISFPLAYTRREFEHAADRMHAGKVDPAMMITSVISLDVLPAVFEEMREPNRQTKVQVAP